MSSRNFELTDPEMEQALANVGMNWSDFEKEKKKKKMTSFKKEPLELLDEKGAIEYDIRSVKKAGRKTKKKRKSKKRGGVRGKRPPPLSITSEELAATPGEPDEMRRDETEELKAFRRAIGVDDEDEEDNSEREAKSTSPEDGDKENLPSPSKKAKMAGGSRKKRRRKTKRRRKGRKTRKRRKTRRHRK